MGKHLLKGTLVWIVVTLIAGCASGPIGKLPAIADEKQIGEITVIRVSSIVGATNSYIVTLNGNEIFGIRSGQWELVGAGVTS